MVIDVTVGGDVMGDIAVTCPTVPAVTLLRPFVLRSSNALWRAVFCPADAYDEQFYPTNAL